MAAAIKSVAEDFQEAKLAKCWQDLASLDSSNTKILLQGALASISFTPSVSGMLGACPTEMLRTTCRWGLRGKLGVTTCHNMSQHVTTCHNMSQDMTSLLPQLPSKLQLWEQKVLANCTYIMERDWTDRRCFASLWCSVEGSKSEPRPRWNKIWNKNK